MKLPKGMTNNKMVKNKKLKQMEQLILLMVKEDFLSKSIYNVIPKIRDLLIFQTI